MDYFELLKNRKSTRKFTVQQLSHSELSSLLLAANAAPVGSNQYKDIYLTVVQNRDILDKLSEAALTRMSDKAKMREIVGSTNISEADFSKADRKFDPFYGAPTVIFVSHRKQNLQPGIEWANAACIMLSMHLAATSLGLGSVFMWGSLEAMREIPEHDNTSVLNLPDGFEPLIGLAVGHPVSPIGTREIDSTKISVNYL